MPSSDPPLAPEVAATVEALLSGAFGGTVRVQSAGVLAQRRSIVRRLQVHGVAGVSSVILKQARHDGPADYDPDDSHPDGRAAYLFSEWAALEFLNRLPPVPRVAPRFLGGDRRQGLLMMEDLGEGDSLADLLLGDDPSRAAAALESLATTLGRLHAATFGRAGEFLDLRRRLGPATGRADPDFTAAALLRRFDRFSRLAEDCGTRLPVSLRSECDIIAATLNDVDAVDAFSPSDACPDNNRVRSQHLVLFDFEGAGFRHAALDVAYLQLALPTCWCVARLPSGLPEHLTAVYHAALAAGGVSGSNRAAIASGSVAACAAWLLWSTVELVPRLLMEDRPSRPATLRQHVLFRLRLFATLATQAGALEQLGEAATRFADSLQRRWIDPAEMPLYPAFSRKSRD
jgi:hypothetical protein